MVQDDATVRLPGRGDPGQTPDGSAPEPRYLPGPGDPQDGTGTAEHAFGSGGPYRSDDGYDDTPVYQPGSVTSYPDEDRTLMLGQDNWTGPTRSAFERDRLLVHGVWEVLLIVLVGGLALFCYINAPKMFSSSGQQALMIDAAMLGMLAVAVSLSLRAATPNLAVGAFSAVAGVLFIRDQGHGTLGAVLLAVGVSLAAGLALGLVVSVLHVPAWAASLGALCAGLAVLAFLDRHGVMVLPSGASVPDPARHASLWLIGVAGVSVLFGLLGLIGPLRRMVGAFRPLGDTAARRGAGAGLMAVFALTISAGLAGAAGVVGTMHTRVAGESLMLRDLLLPLGAVLLGGVSAYGRRGGLFGTMLGVAALTLVLQYGTFRNWSPGVMVYAVAGSAIVLGLAVTRMVEWGGRSDELVDAL